MDVTALTVIHISVQPQQQTISYVFVHGHKYFISICYIIKTHKNICFATKEYNSENTFYYDMNN